MTNKEKYKQAFSSLHASDEISLEVRKMDKKNRTFHIRPAIAVCIIGVFLFGSMATAYAADLGGIHEIVQTWIHGEPQQLEATPNGDGGYTFTYQDGDETQSFGGGGVAIDANGNETALSAADVADTFASEVTTLEDGSVWLYYYSYQIDITDKLVDGACKVTLDDNGENVYFDIKSNGHGGYQMKTSDEDKVIASEYTKVTP